MDAAAGKMWERRTATVTMPTVEIVVIRALRWTIDAVVTVGTMHTQEAMVGIYIFTLRRFRIFVPLLLRRDDTKILSYRSKGWAIGVTAPVGIPGPM